MAFPISDCSLQCRPRIDFVTRTLCHSASLLKALLFSNDAFALQRCNSAVVCVCVVYVGSSRGIAAHLFS